MLVTITQFERQARDANGNLLYVGEGRLGCEARTTAGAFASLDLRTKFIRVATDTSIQMDISGSSTNSADELFPAGSIEYLGVKGGETFSFIVAG